MKISQFSTQYQVQQLTEADLEHVLTLYQTNPLYFEHFPPLPSLESLANDLEDCPPGKELSDKYFLGYVESNPQSSHFWSKVGFCPTGEVKELAGKTIVLAEYALDER
ncbi:hypothetical protein HCC47_01995 [Streptococcus suis]|nr:hypothetical protein [Streptococcus suis]